MANISGTASGEYATSYLSPVWWSTLTLRLAVPARKIPMASRRLLRSAGSHWEYVDLEVATACAEKLFPRTVCRRLSHPDAAAVPHARRVEQRTCCRALLDVRGNPASCSRLLGAARMVVAPQVPMWLNKETLKTQATAAGAVLCSTASCQLLRHGCEDVAKPSLPGTCIGDTSEERMRRNYTDGTSL